eukprot:Gregarina_sp_Poly_1__10455@NODE_75_length_15886_cov_79_326569_g64_i0_p6_GENE_NODE_75_length_15886_cov_79_326569_g64_i0NODE_75_length_15886_cov_79_326569_g64_i0_p6_ORF_typecomplete_len126_score9_16FliW/PF02623_15/0_29FliW/PF02623_15/6_3e03_NODE_75_length_15886_cov_79_326569_g64_i010481425
MSLVSPKIPSVSLILAKPSIFSFMLTLAIPDSISVAVSVRAASVFSISCGAVHSSSVPDVSVSFRAPISAVAVSLVSACVLSSLKVVFTLLNATIGGFISLVSTNTSAYLFSFTAGGSHSICFVG